jgi:1,4-dihydroxy-6-naphthoate synthase
MPLLRIGHSPDADDAFMFYAFAKEKVTIDGYEIQQVLEDIQSLNSRALQGELEVTAISAGAYPVLADKYRIMSCGSSIGRSYGPILLSTRYDELGQLEGKRIAVPGEHTTAYLLLRIFMSVPFEAVIVDFDSVGQAVKDGQVDAGLIIHEGQLTWKGEGFKNLLDLGEEWGRSSGLPIPLGLDVLHRRLGDAAHNLITERFRASVQYAIENEDEAIDYALPFGRGIDAETCRRFVRMYVNQDTLHMGQEGRDALELLYRRAYDSGLISHLPPLDIIGL